MVSYWWYRLRHYCAIILATSRRWRWLLMILLKEERWWRLLLLLRWERVHYWLFSSIDVDMLAKPDIVADISIGWLLLYWRDRWCWLIYSLLARRELRVYAMIGLRWKKSDDEERIIAAIHLRHFVHIAVTEDIMLYYYYSYVDYYHDYYRLRQLFIGWQMVAAARMATLLSLARH